MVDKSISGHKDETALTVLVHLDLMAHKVIGLSFNVASISVTIVCNVSIQSSELFLQN